MSTPENWVELRDRFRSWTGNLLSITRSTSALEALRDMATQNRVSPEQFLDMADSNPAERQGLIERLTVRTTWFMREPDAILALASAFKKRAAATGYHRVTLWSVACATGEEPYTLAMALVEAGLEPTILATDISAEARAVGELGQYRRSRIDDLPLRWRQRFFLSAGSDRVQVVPAIRNTVTFLEHNLVKSQRPPYGWAMFDAVVCRNVLLYFDRDEAVRLLRELSLTCRDEGYVLLSAAEHPIAWSIPALGFEPSNDTPLLRRLRRGDSVTLSRTDRLPERRAERAPDRPPEPTPALAPSDSGSMPRVTAPTTAPAPSDSGSMPRVTATGTTSSHLNGSRTAAPASSAATSSATMTDPARSPAASANSKPPTTSAYSKELQAANTTARQGDLATAITILKQIVERDALAAPAYLAMGLLWKKQGRLAEATSALQRARFLFGDDSWLAPYTLAVCLEARGDWREALEGYRHAAAVLEWGGPSGLVDPDSNEQDYSSTVLESCLQRMRTLQGRT